MDLVLADESATALTEREKKYFGHVNKLYHGEDGAFSNWVREKLPLPVTGFAATDVDMIFYNWKRKNFLVIEIKRKMSECKPAQRNFFEVVHNRLKQPLNDGWEYKGTHLLQFEKLFFNDGKVFLNHKETSEQEMIKFFSME